MSKKLYTGVNGIARNVSKMYVGVNGVARKVKKAYVGVNGVARLFFDNSVPTLDVGVATSIRNATSGGANLDVGVATSIRNAMDNGLNISVITSIKNYTP